MNIPHTFARTIVTLYGETGTRWLTDLPALIDEYAQRWSLRVSPPVTNLSYNYVAPAMREDGTPVILKLGVPNTELASEIGALRHYDGRGSVRLLAGDEERGAMLLERLLPGAMLSELEDDDSATVTAAKVMRNLWRPPPEESSECFKKVEQWALGLMRLRQTFEGGTGPFPTHLVEQAERLFEELLSTMDAPVLLHGDLHHYNILSTGHDDWLAIDPKGVVGEPCYEVGALMRNPYPHVANWPNLRQALSRRADILVAELGFERQRILGWSMAQAVLSGWWAYGDGVRFKTNWMTIAEATAGLL